MKLLHSIGLPLLLLSLPLPSAINLVPRYWLRQESFHPYLGGYSTDSGISVFLAVLFGPMAKAQGNHKASASDIALAVPQVRLKTANIKLPIIDGTNVRFTRLSTADGVSQRKVSHIVQDDQGFLWFATLHGLNRYDGYNLKVFVNDPENPNSLSGVGVNGEASFKDRKGVLWIACDQFLNKFDLVAGTFTRYPIPFVTHISQDAAGILWLATPTEGLYSLDPATGQIGHYSHDPNKASTLSSNHVIYSGEDKEGRFWVATTGWLDEFDRGTGNVKRHIPVPDAPLGFGFYEDRFGMFWIFHVSPHPLSVFDRNTNTLTHYLFPKKEPTGSTVTRVTAMLEDRNGSLWIATHGLGLLKFDREHGRFIRYRNDPSDPDSIPQNDVDALFADREGSIWVGLGSMGPVRFSINPLPFRRFVYNPSGLNIRNPFAGAIYEDRQGILWVGTPKALNRIDRAGNITAYQNGGPETDTDVIAICEDNSGFLWVGTYGHGLLRFDRRTGRFKTYRHNPADPHSLSDDFVSRLLVDHNGILWAGTQDGLNRFNATTESFTPHKFGSHGRLPYLEMVEDRDGILWLGTDSKGLQRFDPVTGQLTAYEHDMNRPGTLSDNRVNSVKIDRTGTMWLGTQNGLNRLDPQTGKFTTYTQRDGLPGNAVSCILEDGRGDLWMSTNNGVARFDPQRKTFKDYSTADGLPGPDLTGWGACYKSSTGEMFFGGFSGATAFFPDKVTDSTYAPPIVLTDFRLFGTGVAPEAGSPLKKTINFTNAVTLSHKQNIFSIEFSALSYFNPATNRYRYMLERLDQHWNEVGSDQRLASYTTLPAGIYTFRLQGATSRGPWTEPGAQLRIEILPPWWNTWWFRALCVAAVLALLWALHRLRVRELRREEQKFREAVETMPAMAFIAGPDGYRTFVNKRWLDYTGLSPEQAEGSGWQVAVHHDDLNRILEKWRASQATGQPLEYEARLRRGSDGAYRWFLTRARPLRDKRGKVVKWCAVATDIEDRKRAEQLQADLTHASRVSTMGELVASISHELAQPITVTTASAKASLRWLQHDPPELTEVRQGTERIIEAGTLASEIINRLRSLYKKAPPKRELVAINEVICEMAGMMGGEARGHGVSIRTDLKDDLPMTVADRVQLQQVLMNLMLNGIEAMNETGGVLTVKSQPRADGQIEISVNDTGPGLPPDMPDRIFDAFFTTKLHGSGLGLAVSKSIVESHGGRIWANGNGGHGATFHFTLPAAPAEIIEHL